MSPAGAFELFGFKFFEREKAADAIDTIGEPQPYEVDFQVSSEDLASQLRGASRVWGDRDEPASGAAGLIAKAREDYRRLLAALYAEGRYGGSISITIDGREASELLPDAELASPASVQVTINPGPVFLFNKASIVNQAPVPLDRRDHVPLPQDQGFLSGGIARSGTILQAERLAVEAWRQQGHAKAVAVQRHIEASHSEDTVDAELGIDPGPRASYGATGVSGTDRMDPEFVAYMAGLPQGAEFDPDDLKRANDRLAKLDVFRSLRIEEGETIDSDGLLPIGVVVQERALRRIGVGGSYSSVDGLGLEAFWLHRNLFGRAERLRIEGRVGGINGVDPDEFTYRLGATFTKPGVYTPDTNFVASAYGDREVLDPYTRTGVNLETGFTHMFTPNLSGRLLARGGYDRFDDDIFGTRYFTTAGFLGGIALDTRDNAADAKRGYFLEAIVEPFYEFEYGNAAARFTAEARGYHGIDDDNRFVAAGRVKVGSLIGASIAETAPDKLFLAGGGGSVRGYAFRNIGVVTPSGLITGGRSLVEASAELRMRVTDTIGAVGFVDAGYVGADSFPDFDENVRMGAGIGLRYLTGLGPIRLDVAVPLDPRPGDPDVAFYVGIGQAF